ncbi:MAG: nuoH [Planctomycetaceae bacterium]|nr:nuoH [Planctomycetaceae bacterium]
MMPLLAVNSIGEYLVSLDFSESIAFTIAASIHVGLVLTFFGVAPLIFIWLERKVAGRIQDRLGPTRVGGRFGWLQTLADGVKLIQKEDLCPEEADKMLFRVSPYLVFVASFGAFIALPFGNGFVAQNLEVGLFFILALMSLEVLGVVFAGYSSGSKWALFGGMREAAQVVSYEIPMAICALIPVITAGTLNLVEIGHLQAGLFTNWLVLNSPFTFFAFFVYFTVATASVKRAPFDLAEAESELVAGFHTEYSGIRWSYFFMAEYASMFAVSGIATFLFLGGWHDGLGLIDLLDKKLELTANGWIGQYIVNVIGLAIFITKGTGLVFFQMWVRWTLPRLRIDQVMMTCLKYLLPISCALFLGATVWPLAIYSVLPKHRTVFSLFGNPTPIGDRLYRKPAVAKVVEKTVKLEPIAETTSVPAAELHGKVQPKAH